MARRQATKEVETTVCPPSVAAGVKTSAEVPKLRRKRRQKPRPIIKKDLTLVKRKRKRKFNLEKIYAQPSGNCPPVQPWTTFSRAALNDAKDAEAQRLARAKKIRIKLRRVLRNAAKRRKRLNDTKSKRSR